MSSPEKESVYNWKSVIIIVFFVAMVSGLMYMLFTDPAYDGYGGRGVDSSYIAEVDSSLLPKINRDSIDKIKKEAETVITNKKPVSEPEKKTEGPKPVAISSVKEVSKPVPVQQPSTTAKPVPKVVTQPAPVNIAPSKTLAVAKPAPAVAVSKPVVTAKPAPVAVAKPIAVAKPAPVSVAKPIVVAKPAPVTVAKPMAAAKPAPATVASRTVVASKPVTSNKPAPANSYLAKPKAKPETVTSSPVVKSVATSTSPPKPKAIKVVRKEDKILSEDELKKIASDILAAGNNAGVYAKCVQLRNTAEGNNKSAMKQIESYLRSNKFTIAGRETVSGSKNGYVVTAVDGCLRLLVGTF